jgi:hypothetical protein
MKPSAPDLGPPSCDSRLPTSELFILSSPDITAVIRIAELYHVIYSTLLITDGKLGYLKVAGIRILKTTGMPKEPTQN